MASALELLTEFSWERSDLPPADPRVLAESLARDDVHAHVTECGQGVVVLIESRPWWLAEGPPTTLVELAIYVTPEARGDGVAAAEMMDWATALAGSMELRLQIRNLAGSRDRAFGRWLQRWGFSRFASVYEYAHPGTGPVPDPPSAHDGGADGRGPHAPRVP